MELVDTPPSKGGAFRSVRVRISPRPPNMPYKDKARQSAYQVQYADRRRQEWIAANGPCCRCGNADRLEVDHIEPNKKVSHRVWFWSEERRNAELDKCQVLCYECHLNKTLAQRPSTEHGRSAMYNKGCRCEVCVESHRIRVAEWRHQVIAV